VTAVWEDAQIIETLQVEVDSRHTKLPAPREDREHQAHELHGRLLVRAWRQPKCLGVTVREFADQVSQTLIVLTGRYGVVMMDRDPAE
jgi:hypothetical protein